MQKITEIHGLKKEGCRIGDGERIGREQELRDGETYSENLWFGWDTGNCREDSLNSK